MFKFYARITTYVRQTEEEALEKLHEMGERTLMYILDVESTEEEKVRHEPLRYV